MEADTTKPSKIPQCDPCRTVFDKQNEVSVGFCVQCVEYLCTPCVNTHRKLKATRGHVLLTGDELPGNKAPFEMLEVIGKCAEHPDDEIAYECEDHQLFLCLNCAKTTHFKCKDLKEIARYVTDESDRSKLSDMLVKIEHNYATIEALKDDKKKNIQMAMKERDEILDKQQSLRIQLEEALKEIDNQQGEVRRSFERKVDKINIDIKRIEKLKNRNTLHGQFAQVTSSYASPVQLYIVASGHYHGIEEQLNTFQSETNVHESDMNINDVKDDILNLLLTIDMSKHLLENTSDSVDDDREATDHAVDENIAVKQNDERPAAIHQSEVKTKTAKSTDENVECYARYVDTPGVPDLSTGVDPLVDRRPFMCRKTDLVSTNSVYCEGELDPCDIVGVTTLNNDDFIAVVDHVNTKLKIFDHRFKFVIQKPLFVKPCGVCSLRNDEIAVLLVEKTVVIFTVSRLEIKQVRSIMLKAYGHSITKYGDKIAVLSSESKFDINKDGVKLPVTIDIYDLVHGNRVNQIACMQRTQRAHRNPCQIYSRWAQDLVLSSKNDMTALRTDGVTRWYYKDTSLRRAVGITSDHEDNLYVCGNNSNNIHQISSRSYETARVLVSDIHSPWAITFDKTHERLLVACRKRDILYVYKFI